MGGILMSVFPTRLGPVEVAPEQRWICAQPLAGFESLQAFVLLHVAAQGPFLWLQSLEVPELAFVVCDAGCFGLSYPAVEGFDPQALLAPPCVLVILPQSPQQSLQVHRQAPLLFDADAGSLRQQVFEADQVRGDGAWVGPAGAARVTPQWARRIISVQPLQPVQAAGG